MSLKPGFITTPWPHTQGDSVSAESLIVHIERDAHRRCGLYYEIYEYNALCALRALYDTLSADDAETFKHVAEQRGHHLDDSTYQASYVAYEDTLKMISKEQV